MAQAAAWHSAGSDVCHDNTACTEGNNIERENRQPGTGGKRNRQNCRRLERELSPRRSSPSRGR